MSWILILLLGLAILGRPLLKRVQRAGNTLGIGGYDCYSLLKNGTPARGILLKVGTQRSAQGTASAGYYEVIAVRIDVEPVGKSPYECDCQLYVPANLRRLVLPGATLELRVDPGSRTNIALFGPGVGLPAAG